VAISTVRASKGSVADLLTSLFLSLFQINWLAIMCCRLNRSIQHMHINALSVYQSLMSQQGMQIS